MSSRSRLNAQRAPDSPPIKTAQVRGATLSYVEQGRGEPVVLIHGALLDYRSWSPVWPELSQRYRVIAYSQRYDYPNPLLTDGSQLSATGGAADLAAFVESLGLSPVHLVGHSRGANLALLLARDRPAMVRSLVLAEGGFPEITALSPEAASLPHGHTTGPRGVQARRPRRRGAKCRRERDGFEGRVRSDHSRATSPSFRQHPAGVRRAAGGAAERCVVSAIFVQRAVAVPALLIAARTHRDAFSAGNAGNAEVQPPRFCPRCAADRRAGALDHGRTHRDAFSAGNGGNAEVHAAKRVRLRHHSDVLVRRRTSHVGVLSVGRSVPQPPARNTSCLRQRMRSRWRIPPDSMRSFWNSWRGCRGSEVVPRHRTVPIRLAPRAPVAIQGAPRWPGRCRKTSAPPH